MKLIIDIPDIDLNIVKNGSIMSANIVNACKSGIPLDDVMAELQKLADDTWNMSVGSVSQGLEDAIEILDNIGKAESQKPVGFLNQSLEDVIDCS